MSRAKKLGFLLATIILGSMLPLSSQAQSFPGVKSLKESREQGIVMQRWENSCAAASVATVLTYGFRDPVTERYAAERMLEKTDPQKVRAQGGFSLLDLKRFVEARGYVGSAYKGLAFDDLRVFHAPIVPISTKGYNHYVVFNGVSGDRVLIADPAFGHLRLTVAEFEKLWMGGMAFVVTRKLTEPQDPPTNSSPVSTAVPAPQSALEKVSEAPLDTPAVIDVSESNKAEIRLALAEWAKSWQQRDIAAYSSYYSSDFKHSQHPSRAAWLRFREQRIKANDKIQIDLENIVISMREPGLYQAVFDQQYSSASFKSQTRKLMVFTKEAGSWRIRTEETIQ
jgi:uncharacterized protein